MLKVHAGARIIHAPRRGDGPGSFVELPGESVRIEKGATRTLGVPPRDEPAARSAVVTEVRYADGSVWRSR